ncbi:uncharacterized protein BO96DRAFT_405047 [Aspergillus niger CBS 101883]|uniref:Uncharacterized protein n=2 Tax=Aspergillus niger TaxID=5061 RepID=A2QJP4_ASPNC|nr:uncharacterized protein BO96DRAFT_405047 [Aspergillus niger CBS 101883]XP_059603668.1 hypothetical protein An04g07780 [Aspergillus niger]PYH50925.1 hypothetical protein BO96DRAFT_405047 [Aspergillus niger CBS 101883]CAK44759.1 hypothetical protein An04g07780 [Aspergillus niger]
MQKNTLTGVVPPAEMKEHDFTEPLRRRNMNLRGSSRHCGHRTMQGRCGFCRRHFKNSATYDSYVDFNPMPWPELDNWSRMSGIWSLLYVFIAYVGIVMELEYQALPTICFKPARSAFSMVANSPGGLDVLATAVEAAALTGSDIALWKAMLTSVEANKKR